MAKLLIKGGTSIKGEYALKAAKNAVLPIIAASLMTEEKCELRNIPHITDIENMLKIMRSLGSKTEWEGECITIESPDVTRFSVSTDLAKELRSSVFLLGPILARMGKAAVAYPGGCDIGVRPLDIHIKGLQELGIAIEESHGTIYCDGTRMHGANVMLDFPSVGATENLMMAASLATGRTKIRNAAKEPEIVDLQNYINAMGGKISGAGGSIIEIEGVKSLHGTKYKPIPDRIVAGTLLIGTAACGGELTLWGAQPEHIEPLLFKLKKSSCFIDVQSDKITLKNYSRTRNFDKVETQPYPGFPTDMQSQMMILMAVSEGTGVIVENIFETRFKIVRELTKMGANITVKDRAAIIRGVRGLDGAALSAGDLRGGAALVLAAMKANGYSTIENVQHIDRGYERIETLMGALGADIVRTK